MTGSVPILELIAISDEMRLASVKQLRGLCDEIEKNKSWEILVGRRDGDTATQIEIFVTMPKRDKNDRADV